MDYETYSTRYQSLIQRLEQANPANLDLIGALSDEYELLQRQWSREPILKRDPDLARLDMRALLTLCAKGAAMMAHANNAARG